jgi:hypothetical protein
VIFYIAMLTLMNSTALQVGRLQVGMTSGVVHTAANDRLASSNPLTAVSIPTRHPCSHAKDVNPQPKLIPVYWPQRDERPGRSEHVQVNILLNKPVINWPI